MERSSDLLKTMQLVGGSQDLDSRGWAISHHSSSPRLEETERAQIPGHVKSARSQLLLLL